MGHNRVKNCGTQEIQHLSRLLARYAMEISVVEPGAPIPGTHFGEPEAGLIKNRLYLRPDTPVHSVLHETCHYICMSSDRRKNLHTDAGGDYTEENGVCYLQILLADEIPDMGRERMMQDMDDWGYTFRLGSTKNWFHRDAEDARSWLHEQGIISKDSRPTWRLRE